MTRRSGIRQKLLDGRYRWGVLSLRTGRYGAESIRVVIYPPNTTQLERRLARLARLWPGITVVLTIIKAPALSVLTELALLVTSAAVLFFLAVVGTALARVSAPVARQRTELFASVSFLSPNEADRNRYDHAVRLAARLHEAEQDLDRGRISWSRYRALWEENYRDSRPR